MKQIWAVLLLLFWTSGAFAQSFPQATQLTVNDYAGVLSQTAQDELDAQLSALRRDTGIEMTVLTLPRQSDFAPNGTMEQFATALFDHWGIGDKDRNDGILVLVLVEDRAMRIELGRAYAFDWNRAAERAIDDFFLPKFRKDDYEGGIRDGVDEVIASIARPFAQGAPKPEITEKSDNPGAFMFIIAALAVGFIFLKDKINAVFTRFKRCPQCGQRGLHRHARTTRAATTTATGTREVITRCDRCDYEDRRSETIAQKSNSSSGFGGGRSGGGGASGRW